MGLSQADFNQMVGDHAPAMYRMAYRLVGDRQEAEDIVQETFRSAWKGRRTFRDGSSQRAWLTSILRRRAADLWRRHPRPLLPGDETPDVGVAAVDPAQNECSDEMQRALDRLPAELREALLLVVVGELTHQETAHLLAVPLGTVLSRVSRARRRLREYLLAGRGHREEAETK